MIKEAGGINTKKAKEIRQKQLYGIEADREIYALACANMLIHKDGKTNLAHLDSRLETACSWIQSKPITKVLMNPPFESKYGCLEIVANVLENVKRGTPCAFILPDKKLEKEKPKKVKRILDKNTLKKIIKLPEKTFKDNTVTSIYIFEAGIPHRNKDIFACYIKEDGLETVKNQGRQDIKDKWQNIEDRWVKIIEKLSGDSSIQWIKPNEHLSYQMPEKVVKVAYEDFAKTAIDYLMYKNGIDVKEFNEKILNKVLYSSIINSKNGVINLKIK